MDQEEWQIGVLTGVDVSLKIAGAGSRSYAFLLDWQIRTLLALAGFAGAWLWLGDAHGAAPLPTLREAGLPALVIYLLYHPVVEVLMRGRSPGKRMAGVRLVTRRGGTPGTGALLLRNVLRLLDSLPALYLVGLASCLLTRQRVRIGDLAAGTLLVIDSTSRESERSAMSHAVVSTGLAPEVVELVEELLERWRALAEQERRGLARALLTRIGGQDASVFGLNDGQLQQRLKRLL